MFHWILAEDLNPGGDRVEIVHYLDHFLMIVPPGQNPSAYSKRFRTLSVAVGLAIKESKNEKGRVGTFGGIELNTGPMVIRLREKKLIKAWNVGQKANASNLSLTHRTSENYRLFEFCCQCCSSWENVPPQAL